LKKGRFQGFGDGLAGASLAQESAPAADAA
jgi:hypothetical protein